jgi:hypothetical protein
MSTITFSRALSPLALTLLVATTGCTLDQAHEPSESTNEGGPGLYLTDGNVRAEIVTSDLKVSVQDSHGISLRDDEDKLVPPAPLPEGEDKHDEDEPAEPGPSEEDTETLVDDDVPLSNITELAGVQIRGLVDAIVFATPARMAPQLDDASFVNFDFAGATTTSAQGLANCTDHRISAESNELNIRFECQNLGDDAPSGDIRCSADFSLAGAVKLACEATLQSNLGDLAGNINVVYEINADVAVVDTQFRRNDGAQVTGHYATDEASNHTHAGSCHVQSGSVTTQKDGRIRAAQFKGLKRCDNACRPSLGTVTIALYEANEDQGTQISLVGLTSGWVATDGSSNTLTLPLCQ